MKLINKLKNIMPVDINVKKVAIILGFFNGNKYIIKQLKSIISQSHKNIKIFIFDDNSNEKTIDFKSFIKENNEIEITYIRRSNNIGYAKNFLQGLKDIGPAFDYYSFSDQDDIWEINKIEQSLKDLDNLPLSIPSLYCSRTSYYNEKCTKEIGSSKHFPKKPNFKNALIQNIAGGNTITINKSARNLIVNSLKCNNYISHDWWCYQLISAAGGNIIFSSDKLVRYRQHNLNLIGGNQTSIDKLKRFRKFISGDLKEWNDINIENLIINKNLVSEKNLITIRRFQTARKSKNIFKKLFLFFQSGVHRQTIFENIAFILGLIFNRI